MAANSNAAIPVSLLSSLDQKTCYLAVWIISHALANKDEYGSVSVSYNYLSSETSLTARELRTCLSKLVSDKVIDKVATKSPTKLATKLSLCDLDRYSAHPQSKRQSKRQSSDNATDTVEFEDCSQRATNTNDSKSLESRKQSFYQTMVPYVFNESTGQGYHPEMLRAFYDYWSEPNKSGTKMRFELEKTWSLEGRLRTWASRDKNFNNYNNGTDTLNTKAQRQFEAMCADTARGIARRSKIDLPDDLI